MAGLDESAGANADHIDWVPLVNSLLAGLSTCLGASVVFLAARRGRGASSEDSQGKDPSSPLSDKHLCFSIAFAGSVMVTVSLFSLLPESFSDESSVPSSSFVMLAPTSRLFWERIGSFFAGCGLCLVLSKVAFPEPDEILDLHQVEPEMENLFPRDQRDLTTPPAYGVDNVNNSQRRQEALQQQSIVKRQSSVVMKSENSQHRATPSIVARTSSMQTLSPDVEGGALGVQTLSPVINDDFEGGSLRWWYRFSSGSDLTSKEARRSWRVAVLLFVSLLAHNFPEGFAVAATSVHSPKLGVTTAIAIAFHNIPEGIAIAVPCLAARPDAPWLAFGLASLSGLAEPLGAAVALLVLRGGASGTTAALDIDSVLSFVAGVMVTVALNELFPEARRHSADGKGPLWLGTLAGAVVMLVSDAILDATY